MVNPTSHDILGGRGIAVQNHPGNRYYHKAIKREQPTYASLKKTADKNALANHVLCIIQNRSPPGRFLVPKENGYVLMSKNSALEKIKQALREGKSIIPCKRSPTTTSTASKNEPTTKKTKPPKASKIKSENPTKSKNSKRSGNDYSKEDFDLVLELLSKDKK